MIRGAGIKHHASRHLIKNNSGAMMREGVCSISKNSSLGCPVFTCASCLLCVVPVCTRVCTLRTERFMKNRIANIRGK